MKRIDRYMLGKFLFNLSWSVLAFWAIFVIVNLIENLDKFIDKDVPAQYIALYYWYYSPYIVVLIAPIAVLLATLFAVGFLAKNNELLAMRATGMSLWRLSVPLLLMGLVLTGVFFQIGETIYPRFEIKRNAMKQKYLKGRKASEEIIYRNLYVPGGNGRVYYFRTFNSKSETGTDVMVQIHERGRLVETVELDKLAYRDSIWVGGPGGRRVFATGAESAGSYEPIDSAKFPSWTETPEDIMRKRINPQQMCYADLQATIVRMRNTGHETHSEETELALKVAFPFINVLVILIGFPIASRTRQSGMALNFAMAMMITFFVRILYEIFRSLGHSGQLDPMIAAWTPNAIAFLVGLIVLIRARK